MSLIATDETSPREHSGLSRKELLKQLERIVSSSHFRNSKRYPSFLRFIVERTVEDNTEVLKERNLGTEVFGRPSDYDTNADPIVRVTAGEVRKRIAQYYQAAGHEHELRIDLPLGSYVPQFHSVLGVTESRTQDHSNGAPLPVAMPVPVANAAVVLPKLINLTSAAGWRRWFKASLIWHVALYFLAATGFAATSYFVASTVRSRFQNSGTDYFWQSFASTGKDALIVIGVHFMDSQGKSVPARSRASSTQNQTESALASMESSDMVPVSDIVSYSKLTDLLTRRSLAYSTKGSADTTLDDMRLGPVVLLGGFDNLWTLRLISTLRYRFVPKSANVNEIQDSQNPSTFWVYDNLQPALGNSRDYAIVASYFDPTIEQHVIIAAGIGKNGTIAAAEFLSTERDMKNWLAEAKLPANKNIELVLSTEVLDGQPGPPHVIASSAW